MTQTVKTYRTERGATERNENMNTQVTRPGHMVPGWKLSPSEAELCKMEAERVFQREHDHARRMGVLAAASLTLSLIAAAILLGVAHTLL